MSQRKLSSLNVLNTFVTACETQSFKAAAEELSLSASAVSRQIQALEGELGFGVFDRLPRGLALTDKGQQFYISTKEAISILETSIDNINFDGKTDTIRLSSQIYFTKHWLMPRLNDFYTQYPSVKIHFESRNTYNDFDPSIMDVAVRFDPPKDDQLQRIKLVEQYALPVASPGLVEEYGLNSDATGWAECIWLKIDSVQDVWERWLAANNTPDIEPFDIITFDDAEAVMQGAVESMGIAVVAWPLANRLIEEGKLVALCEPSAALCSPYYLVYPTELENHPPLIAFKDWMQYQASKEPDIKDFK